MKSIGTLVFIMIFAAPILRADDRVAFDQTRDSFVFPISDFRAKLPLPIVLLDVNDTDSVDEKIAESRGREIEEVTSDVFLEVMMRELVDQTPFSGKLNFHGEYSADKINLYFLDQKNIDEFAPGIEICSYIPPKPLIVCNGEKIKAFSDNLVSHDRFFKIALVVVKDGQRRLLEKSEMSETEIATINTYLSVGLVTWIVAHELGHAVLHSDSTKTRLFFNSTVGGEIEREADEYAADLILKTEFAVNNALYSIDELVEAHFYEIVESRSSKLIRVLPEYDSRYLADNHEIELDANSPRDLLTFRGSRIYKYVADRHEFRDTTEFFNKVNENIVLKNPTWRRFLPDFVERWIE